MLYKVVKSIPPIPVSVLINIHSASRSARAEVLPRTWPNPLGSTTSQAYLMFSAALPKHGSTTMGRGCPPSD